MGGQAWMDRQMDEGWVNGVGDGTSCRVPNPKFLFLLNMTFFALFGLLGINPSSRRKNSSGHPLETCFTRQTPMAFGSLHPVNTQPCTTHHGHKSNISCGEAEVQKKGSGIPRCLLYKTSRFLRNIWEDQ